MKRIVTEKRQGHEEENCETPILYISYKFAMGRFNTEYYQ